MANLALYLTALTLVFLLPGPDMILLLQTGARQGRALALATAAGLALARTAHVSLAALGLATLFKVAPWTFELVRFMGATYLLWLGVKMLKPGALGSLSETSQGNGPASWRAAIGRGVLTNLLNPKALLFCSVLLPQFIDPAGAAVPLQFATLGAILVLGGLLFDCAYALLGARLGQWLERSPSARRVQQWLFGGLLIGFAVRLAFIQQA